MSKKFKYDIFGSLLESEIDLKYLSKSSSLDTPDFSLAYGKVEPLNVDDMEEGTFIKRKFKILDFTITTEEFHYDIYDVAKIRIIDKSQLIIEPYEDVKEDIYLPYFYGTALTVLLHMHLKFPMHGSGVVSEKGLNLFCADSGVGKSTLAMNLHLQGFPLFTDDKCVLKYDQAEGKFVSTPSIKAVRLCEDALEKIKNRIELPEGKLVMSDDSKMQFNLNNEILNQRSTLNKIFVIRLVDQNKTLRIRPLKIEEKVAAIRNQLHRPGMVVGRKQRVHIRQFTKNLATITPVLYVEKPKGIPVEEFVDFMKEQIQL